MSTNNSEQRRNARHRRAAAIRKRLRGTDNRPRLCVFRSNRYLYVQVISDESGRTVAAASTLGLPKSGSVEAATALGKEIADRCKTASIADVVFDRNGYQYHGRVKALAEAAREGGLRF